MAKRKIITENQARALIAAAMPLGFPTQGMAAVESVLKSCPSIDGMPTNLIAATLFATLADAGVHGVVTLDDGTEVPLSKEAIRALAQRQMFAALADIGRVFAEVPPGYAARAARVTKRERRAVALKRAAKRAARNK
jgi:hypothetical protein